jgi:uncharacterized protein (DUF58 family)
MPNRRNAIYALIISSLIIALLTGRALLFTLVYILVALLAVSAVWAWISVQWIGVRRKTRSTRAQVGHTLEENFRVSNTAWLPRLWLEVRDHSTLAGHNAGYVVPAMAGRSSYEWKAQTPCLARGEFQLGPMEFISGDPFGLFTSTRRINATSRVVVYPQTVRLSRFELPMGILSGGDAQRQRTHVITTNAAGVRDYVNGDSFNRIHWKTSARRDSLMVKEFELDPLVDIWLFVDFNAAALVEAPNVERVNGTGPVIPRNADVPESTEEYAVVAAASLAQHFLTGERAVGFAAYTPSRIVHQPERGGRQLNRVLESLATARSFTSYTLAQMLTLETHHLSRGTTLIIVTASLDASWVNAAQMLNSKGIRPLAVLVDPTSFGAYGSSIDDLRSRLRNARVPHVVLRNGDDLSAVLGAGAL